MMQYSGFRLRLNVRTALAYINARACVHVPYYCCIASFQGPIPDPNTKAEFHLKRTPPTSGSRNSCAREVHEDCARLVLLHTLT